MSGTVTTTIQQRLQQLRPALLDLHKALVDSERISYEQTMGSVPSPNHFLQLLMRTRGLPGSTRSPSSLLRWMRRWMERRR